MFIVMSIVGAVVLFNDVVLAMDLQSGQYDNENKGIYLGTQLGYANLNYDDGMLTGDPNISSVGSVDKTGAALRLFFGYQFNQYIATELGVVALPKVKFNDITYNGISGISESFNQTIVDLVAKGILPLKYNFSLYGKAGVASVLRDDVEVSAGGTTTKANNSDTKTVPVLGAGVSYNFTQHVAADLSYMRYFGSGDLKPVDLGLLGISYLF
jgi:outer membrane autotransporter protein